MESITQIGIAIQNYGITSIAIGAAIYLVVQIVTTLVKYFLEERKDKKENKQKVKAEETLTPHKVFSVKELRSYHTILVKIDSLVKTRIPLMTLGGPVRTKIFKSMLIIYFSNFKRAVDELLDEEITLNNFYYKNEAMITEVLEQTMHDWEEDGIPIVVITKFQEWNSKRIAYLNLSLNDIDSSQVIDNVVEKQYMALNLYSGIVYLTFVDAEKTLSTLNGSLTGQYYKGEQIEGLR